MTDRPKGSPPHRDLPVLRRRLLRWGPLVLLVGLALAGYLTGIHEKMSLSYLIRQHEALHAVVERNAAIALVMFVAVYVATTALSFPGASLLTILGGFLFGWLAGGAATVVGATAGATVLFLIARSSVGAAMRERVGGLGERVAAGFREDAMSYLLFLRLVPLFPFWLVNIAPALFDVPLRTFVIATAIGIVPGTVAYAVLGSGLDSIIAAQEHANPGCAAAGTCEIDPAALLTPKLLAGFALLGLVALVPVVVKRWRRRRKDVGTGTADRPVAHEETPGAGR